MNSKVVFSRFVNPDDRSVLDADGKCFAERHAKQPDKYRANYARMGNDGCIAGNMFDDVGIPYICNTEVELAETFAERRCVVDKVGSPRIGFVPGQIVPVFHLPAAEIEFFKSLQAPRVLLRKQIPCQMGAALERAGKDGLEMFGQHFADLRGFGFKTRCNRQVGLPITDALVLEGLSVPDEIYRHDVQYIAVTMSMDM